MMKPILLSPFLYVMGIVMLAVLASFSIDIREFAEKYPREIGILAAIFLVSSVLIAVILIQSNKKTIKQEVQAKLSELESEVQQLARKLESSERERERYKNLYQNLHNGDKEAEIDIAVRMYQEENK